MVRMVRINSTQKVKHNTLKNTNIPYMEVDIIELSAVRGIWVTPGRTVHDIGTDIGMEESYFFTSFFSISVIKETSLNLELYFQGLFFSLQLNYLERKLRNRSKLQNQCKKFFPQNN